MADPLPIRRVLVTGASGNLGRKLIAHLAETEWCEGIVGVDRTPGAAPHTERVSLVVGDLLDPDDRLWRDALGTVQAVVHLASANPAPDSSWTEACQSIDMTAYLLAAAAQAGVRRLVFASSNHVMGQYKDPPLADEIGPGGLRTDLPPGPGTRWFNGERMMQGTAYAVSKLMGERLCVSAARMSAGAFTTVSLRIGWCQPGDNRPETITASGVADAPLRADSHPEGDRNLRWFRSMWLSNRDYVALVERAILAPAEGWPAPGIVVNGMSANAGMGWDIETTRRLIGYEAQDNIGQHLS